jgi:hypothetical protein
MSVPLWAANGSSTIQFALCYQTGAASPALFLGSFSDQQVAVATDARSFSTGGVTPQLPAGTYKVAICTRNPTANTINAGWQNGFVMAVN